MTGIGLFLTLRYLDRKVTAQKLLREAANDGGALEEIFYPQAGEGYYRDTVRTARLYEPNDGREFSAVILQLVRMRAENEEIPGRKQLVAEF